MFCYNAQPGVDIDYETGDNKLSEDASMLEDYQAGKFTMIANTLGVIPSEEESLDSDEPTAEEQVQTYVLNTNTKKFHKPECSSVDDMKEKNTLIEETTRSEIIDKGYKACKRCNP